MKKFKSSKVEKLKSANLSTWLLFLLFNLSTFQPFNSLAKTFDVDISTGKPAASNEAFYHGETIEFRAVRGRTVVTNIEYSCIWYQTNGMDQAWWKTDGLVFHPTNDCGAAAYRFFLEGRDEIGRDWHANGLLRFLPSPGFEPNAIERPVLTLDFANIEVLNPPWSDTDLTPATNYTDEAVAAQSAAQSAALADATNALNKAKQDKLPYPTNAIPQGAVSGLDSSLSGKLDNGGGTLYGSLYFEGEDRTEWDFINLSNAGEYPGGMTIGYKTYDRLFMFNSWDASFNMTTVRLPADKDGTVAFTSDIPNISGKADKADVAAAARAATNYTDEAIGDISFPVRSVNQKNGAVTLAASDVGAYSATDGQALAGQVTAIGAHINGEDAKVIVTNYNSSTHLPEAEFDINVSNNWLVVWREMTRWNWFLGDVFAPYTNAVAAAIANKSEREYAFFDGVTGEPAPDGFFWISQPRVAIAGGMAYQRYIDTAGEVWVLESNGMVADINGTTNGYIRISDDQNNVQFEIVKGNSRTVTAAAGTMTCSSVMGVTHWHTTYMVTNAVTAPKAMFCRDIANPEWYAEDDAGCPCNVDWTHPSERIYVCEWWPQGDEPKMFMRSQYGQGSESRIIQNAPVEMQYIVIGGTKYALGTATIDGKTVLTLSTP